MRIIPVAVATALLSACQPVGDAASTQRAANLSSFERGSAEWRGERFARNRCSDCHAVARDGDSPRREAPAFERIANTPGLTRATLGQWLRDAHNYPDAMYFEIPEEGIDDLVAYMITLQREDYEPPI